MTQKAKLFDERMKTLADNLELRKATTARLEEELAASKHSIDALTTERDALVREQKHYQEIDSENIKFRQENYILSEENQERKRELAEMETKINELFDENHELKASFEQLKGKLVLLRELEGDLEKTLSPATDFHHSNNTSAASTQQHH